MHTARQLTRLLRFVRPFRCFFKILDRHSGNLAAFLQRHVIGLYGPIKPRCMLLNKRLIYPPLFDHISKQAVKQSRVRTRLYRQMQYTFLACNLARNVDGWCFTRVYEDDARWWQLLSGKSFFLLAAGLAR